MVRARGRIASVDRIRMADQCSRFLAWALRHSRHVPRIPHQREGSTDFSRKIKRAFWGHALEAIERGLAKTSHPDDF